jgi:hypothetical protein
LLSTFLDSLRRPPVASRVLDYAAQCQAPLATVLNVRILPKSTLDCEIRALFVPPCYNLVTPSDMPPIIPAYLETFWGIDTL